MRLSIPIKTKNPLNGAQWGKSGFARSRERQRQRNTTRLVWLAASGVMPAAPWVVTLTRIAPRELDSHDGLRASLKAVVDQLAAEIGLATDSDPRVTWAYKQRKGGVREYAVEVEIESVATGRREQPIAAP